MPVNTTDTKKYYYLALGDSYTIGQSVAEQENFPNHVAGIMLNNAVSFFPPRIIANILIIKNPQLIESLYYHDRCDDGPNLL